MKNVLGILACLRILTNAGEHPEEQFTNLLTAIKRENPDVDLSELERDLAQNPDAVRRASVERVRRGIERERTDTDG